MYEILSNLRIGFKIKTKMGFIKLTGKEIYHTRVGNYRILYEIFDKLVLVAIVKVGHRRDIYK